MARSQNILKARTSRRRQQVLGSAGRRLLLFKASLGIQAACCTVKRVPHHPHRDNGLGQACGNKRCRERVCAPGAPRRVGNCFLALRWSIGGRSLAAHLVLSAPAEPQGKGAHGARRRGPVPDICCQPRRPRRQDGTGVRQRRVILEPAGC